MEPGDIKKHGKVFVAETDAPVRWKLEEERFQPLPLE